MNTQHRTNPTATRRSFQSMSLGLTILLALAAWALGPLILRCAGGLLAICALVLWAIPMETHTSTVALVFTAVTGTAMWHKPARSGEHDETQPASPGTPL